MERALNRNISFHLFPQHMEIRKKWLETLQLQNYEPKKSAAVCSVHFKETDYQLDHKYRKLKQDAIPHLSETEIQPGITIQSDSGDLPINLDSDNPPFQTDLGAPNHQIISIEENPKADNTTKMVHRSTSISPDRIMNSPMKTRIRKVYTDTIKSLNRKLSISHYKEKKAQKKLSRLKNILKDLQKQNLL